MRIVTNFNGFPHQWTTPNGQAGSSCFAQEVSEFVKEDSASAIWLVNCNPNLTIQLALRRRRARLIAADLVLRKPRGLKGALRCYVQSKIFARVDGFIHYFRDISGLKRFYNIDPMNSFYVPFKVNIGLGSMASEPTDGEYALCFGRSQRDFDSFFEAMEKQKFRGAITVTNKAELSDHGAKFTREINELPSNVAIIPDDGSVASMVKVLSGARIVVVPTLKTSLVASGISTALNAMSLGKCVIGTEGPGMSDVFRENEVIVARPEDPSDLARCMQKAWDSADCRQSTARAGLSFARQAGDNQAFYERLIQLLSADVIPQENKTFVRS